MMPRCASRSARSCARCASALLCVACSSPELGDTLFSCARDDDCAPGQVCAAWQGELACQHRPSATVSPCGDSNCSTPLPVVADAPLQGERFPAAGAAEQPACGERSCASERAPVSMEERSLEPLGAIELADAGAGGETLDASSGAAAATPPDAGLRNAGGNETPADSPRIRFDFETSLEGWQSVRDQRPEDTLDGTERSTELAHQGRAALRMVYDGSYTPLPGVSASSSFYGAYEPSAPPPGAEVSLWVLSTAPSVSVEVYSQTSPTSARTILATAPLTQNQWRNIIAVLPGVEAQQFGVRVLAAPDLRGFVYLDEISW